MLPKIFSKVSSFGNYYYTEEDESSYDTPSTLWSIVLFVMTVFALMVSWTLNRDMRVRGLMGFDKPAGFFGTIGGMIAVFIVGPVLYLLGLVAGAFDELGAFLVPSNASTTWLRAIQTASKDIGMFGVFRGL